MPPLRLPIPSLSSVLTARLSFRQITMDDVNWWMDYINSAEAIRFMPFTIGSRDDCAMMIKRSLDRYAEDGSGLHAVVLREGNIPIGQCGLLTQVVDGEPELEIGYHFLPQHWGNGYAAEAAIACKEFARTNAIAPSVISLIDAENVRSQSVAKRNGMTAEKTTIHRGTPAIVFRVGLTQ